MVSAQARTRFRRGACECNGVSNTMAARITGTRDIFLTIAPLRVMLVAAMTKTTALTLVALAAAVLTAQQQKQANPDLGFTDTPILPGLKWHVHDPDRPHPPVVTPGDTPFAAPSDAIVLFDGKNLSKWAQDGRDAERGKLVDAKWP